MAFSFWWVGLHVQAWTTVASLAFHPELTDGCIADLP